MKLGMQVGLGPGHIVSDGDPAPPHPKGHSPPPSQFSAHVCCDQTIGWIKMPLGREVGLGPSHIVLDGDPIPPGKRGIASNFRPMSIVAKRSPISTTAEHILNTGCPYYTGQTTFRCYQPLFQEQLRVAVTALHASTKSSIHGTSLVP